MAVQPVAKPHTSFQVDMIAHHQHADIGTIQGFFHSGHCILIALNIHHGQAHTIMRHTLVYLHFMGDAAAYLQVHIAAFFFTAGYLPYGLDDSCKHYCADLIRCMYPRSGSSTFVTPVTVTSYT